MGSIEVWWEYGVQGKDQGELPEEVAREERAKDDMSNEKFFIPATFY